MLKNRELCALSSACSARIPCPEPREETWENDNSEMMLSSHTVLSSQLEDASEASLSLTLLQCRVLSAERSKNTVFRQWAVFPDLGSSAQTKKQEQLNIWHPLCIVPVHQNKISVLSTLCLQLLPP